MKAAMLATAAGLALAGPVLAQPKPSPQGAPQQALPTSKPPALGAPQQAQPAPRATPPQGQPAPQQPPAFNVPPAAQAPQAVPPNEPAAVTRLRGLLGAEVRLSYASAQALDSAGEQVRLTGVVLEQPGKRATADEVTINGLRENGVAEAVVRGLATEESGTRVRIGLVRLAGLTVPRTQGGPPKPEDVRLDGLRIEGVETSGATTMRLAMMSFENWLAGQPARFTMQGLDVTGIDGGGVVDAVRIARFAFAGIDLATLTGALMRQERPRTLVGRASVELDGLDLAGGGRPVGRMTEMRIGADVTNPDGTGTGTMAFRGIRVEATPIIAAWLTRFGYQAIDADISSTSAFEGTSGRIDVRDFSIAVRDAGTLSLSLALDGLTQERMQAADFTATRLISVALRYADASLFGRVMASQAREARTPEPQLREQLAAMAGGALSQPGAAALDPIRDAVQRFIRGQARTIEIRANPPRPLGMADIQGAPPNPAEAQRLLGITATAQ